MIEEILKATHKGILKIGDTEINCFVLKDGRRLLSGRAVTSSIGLRGRGQGMSRFLESKSLKPLISHDFIVAIENPITFTAPKGLKPIYGYEATLLPELCNIIIDANDHKPLPSQQQHMVKQAKILQRAFSIVGIIALVDEATGYQEVRDKLALQKILEKYISPDLLPWTKQFPDEFYKELFRLRGWQWKGMSVNRPSYVGTLTNDIVYERLAPGVLEELKRITPRDEKGRTRHRYHQRLTVDIGHRALSNHLHATIALMKAFPKWDGFYRALQRALPKPGDQLAFDLEEGENNKN